MPSPQLSYVAMVCNDIPGASRLLGEVLGLPRSTVALGSDRQDVFAIGRSALAFFPPGHDFVEGETRSGVHHIGLDYGGMEAPALAAGSPRAALGGGSALPIDPALSCGVRIRLSPGLEIDRGMPASVFRIDHLGIASADNIAAIAACTGPLRMPLESTQTDMEVEHMVESFTSDKYGVVYHSRKPKLRGGLRVAFLTTGDCDLEFLQNFDPDHGAEVQHGTIGNTRQDQSAITKFVASRGQGLHHVCLKSPDIDATLALLEAGGARIIDRVGRPGSRRGLIGFIHPVSFGGILFHLIEHPGERRMA